jgi:VanZ family protein
MLPHRLPRPVRLGLYALASAILLYLCLAPSTELPQPGIGDKWEHGVAWMVLVLTGLALSPRRPRAIVAYALVLAVAVEVLQGLMGFGRDADWRDVVADAIGVAVALAIAWAAGRLFSTGSAR